MFDSHAVNIIIIPMFSMYGMKKGISCYLFNLAIFLCKGNGAGNVISYICITLTDLIDTDCTLVYKFMIMYKLHFKLSKCIMRC